MNRRGKRSSAAYAFVEPLKDDPRLTVRLHAAVRKIEIENGRAVGVTYARRRRAPSTPRARRGDIVVTAGALVTPKLLMLSGIGPADHLREHGIAVHRRPARRRRRT